MRGELALPVEIFSGCPVLHSGLTPWSAVNVLRRDLWHRTMHAWCPPSAKASVFAVFVAELRMGRRAEQETFSCSTTCAEREERPRPLPAELWLCVLEFVRACDLGALP